MPSTKALEMQLMNLKMAAMGLNRSSKKCEANEKKEKKLIKQCLQKGNQEGAKIHAESAIREKNQALHFLKLSARLDGVTQRIQTALTMQQVSDSMRGVVSGMDKAMKAMNLVKMTEMMDKFEQQQEDIDVKVDTMDSVFQSTSVTMTNQTEIENLMGEVIDEHGLEVDKDIASAGKHSVGTTSTSQKEQDELAERLAALRQTMP